MEKYKIEYSNKEFQSAHNLNFEQYLTFFGFRYRIGTIEGIYIRNFFYIIVKTVENKRRGNGHFKDFEQWFEYLTKKYQKSHLIHFEVLNPRLYKYYIKEGFKPLPNHIKAHLNSNKSLYKKF